jgi:enoyl-CoA hydratase
LIDRAFVLDGVEDIIAALDAEGQAGGVHAGFAAAAAASIRTKSPTSLKITHEQIRRGATLDFDACMRTELRIVSRIVEGHDLYEGIRAVIIDKDQSPRWRPARLADVSDNEVARYFTPLARELDLP